MNLHVHVQVVYHTHLQVVNDTLIDYEYEARRSDVSTGEPVATDIKLTCFDKDGASVQKTLQVFIDDVNEQPEFIGIVGTDRENMSVAENSGGIMSVVLLCSSFNTTLP